LMAMEDAIEDIVVLFRGDFGTWWPFSMSSEDIATILLFLL